MTRYTSLLVIFGSWSVVGGLLYVRPATSTYLPYCGYSAVRTFVSRTRSWTSSHGKLLSDPETTKNLWTIEECIEQREQLKFIDASWYHKGERNGRQEYVADIYIYHIRIMIGNEW